MKHTKFTTKAKRVLGAAALVATIATPAISQAGVLVIENGTFDDQTGWSGTFNNQAGGSGGFPALDTASYYWGGNNAYNEIEQTYTLGAGELSTLSSLGYDYSISADLFGFATQSDFSTFTAEFRDAANGVLSSISLTSTTNDPGTWANSYIAGSNPLFQEALGALPTLTASIRFIVSSTRQQGFSNDGYLDNASFELLPGKPVASVPEPTGLALLGLGALAFIRRRKL